MNKLLSKLLGGLIIVSFIISSMTVFGMKTDSGQAILELSNSKVSEEVYSLSLGTLMEDSDYGNDFQSATELALNTEALGQISSSDDVDFFKFTTDTSEGMYTLEFSGTGAASIEIYDFERCYVDNDSFDSENSYTYKNSFQPNTGYYIKIKSDESNVSYTVRLIKWPDDYGISQDSASTLNLNEEVTGKIDYESDTDYFKFITNTNGIYSLNYSGTGDAQLYFVDGTGASILNVGITADEAYSTDLSLNANEIYHLQVCSNVSGMTYKVKLSTATPKPTPTQKPLLPKGYLDTPKENATISGKYTLYGWYIDINGVSEIEVKVDGKVDGIATYGLLRTDIKNAYPAYDNENAGYRYYLDTTKLENGTHTIEICEIDNNGKRNSLPVRTVQVLNNAPEPTPAPTPTSTPPVTPKPLLPKGHLDTPKENATISGKYALYGWYIDINGVSEIEVIVDGELDGKATYGLLRTDIKNAYPAYDNENAGYRYYLDTTKLENGTHTVEICEIDNNGNKSSLPARTVQVLNNTPVPTATPKPTQKPLSPKGHLDTPKENATISGKYALYGWYLDINGVSEIEVIVDGKVDGKATYGLLRTDIKNAYPAYDNENAGYRYYLDTTKLENGTHTIEICGIDNNGQRNSLPVRTVQVLNTTTY